MQCTLGFIMIKLISVLSLIMLQPLCHVTSSIADMSPHLEGMEFPLRMVLYCVFYEFSWT